MKTICKFCKGTGTIETALPIPMVIPCLTCKGTGKLSLERSKTKRKFPLKFWTRKNTDE